MIIGIALVSVLNLPHMHKLASTYSQDYGNAIATMAANQAIDAAFNHDLVRLQVILQDVMENPTTQLATIHDVENNLLVQAGDARTPLESVNTFTAPIVLHDSIAGYLSVSLSPYYAVNDTQQWLITLFLVALFLVLAMEIYRHNIFELEWNKHTDHACPDPTGTTENNEEQIDEDQTKVYSIIHIKNLAVLKQQLNVENFRKTMSTVEHTISDVLALYNGAGYQLDEDQLRLTFYANDATNEALFRAACSAWLVVELASITNNVPLDLGAFVSANQLDLVPANLPIAGLVLESQAASDELITRRLRFLDVGSEDGRKVVAGFEQPFQSLLEKQRSQLSKL